MHLFHLLPLNSFQLIGSSCVISNCASVGGASANLWKGCTLAHQVMHFWLKRRDKLIHDYSLVGYILSPHPTIMAHAVINKSTIHDEAVERLITKLILDSNLVGEERTISRARLIDTFLTEHGDFINKRNSFARDNIWIMAKDPSVLAYSWHQKYSLPVTKVLGKLASSETQN